MKSPLELVQRVFRCQSVNLMDCGILVRSVKLFSVLKIIITMPGISRNSLYSQVLIMINY